MYCNGSGTCERIPSTVATEGKGKEKEKEKDDRASLVF